DDQHGTAIVVLAALLNALKVARKELTKVRIIVNGAGSAGVGITRLLVAAGVTNIVVVDTEGAIYQGRAGLTRFKEELAEMTNNERKKGGLEELVKGADVFIGASSAGVLSKEHVISMASTPIVFALANPIPEIAPEDAKEAGAAVIGTGSSEHENQINNLLAFPGVFRGVLDCRASVINVEMRLAAARAIASLVKKPTAGAVIPQPLDRRVAPAVARAVVEAAMRTGAATKLIKNLPLYQKIAAARIKGLIK
ncbi:MAG: NAD-dependent malic enzyme, partial [Candidatus Aenigmarchaeota archaeon]|nr:NAD-dependent malic enzyme [Candidatus Aenigmarchaeota archaeon]